MITAVDTSILLDVFVDADDADQSEALLIQAYERGSLIISPAVYAELVPQTQSQDELDRWLSLGGIDVIPFTKSMRIPQASLMQPIERLAGNALVFWLTFSSVRMPSMKPTCCSRGIEASIESISPAWQSFRVAENGDWTSGRGWLRNYSPSNVFSLYEASSPTE